MNVNNTKKIPQSNLSFIGKIKSLSSDSFNFLCQMADKPIYQVRVGLETVFFINHPQIAQHILKDNVSNYPKDMFYAMVEDIIGKNLFTTTDMEYWTEHRKLMANLFHQNSVQNMFNDINQITQSYIKTLESQNKIQLNHFCASLTMEVIAKLMFGVHTDTSQINKLADDINYFTHRIIAQRKLWFFLSFIPFLPRLSPKFNRHLKRFNDTLLTVLTESGQAADADNFFTRMQGHLKQENQDPLTSKELISEAALILFAGHETTAAALMWSLVSFSQYPLLRQQIQEEIDTVCNGAELTIEHLMKMPILDKAVKEVLRLYPSFPNVTRTSIKEDTIMGYTIPANANLIMNIAAIHRNPEFWDEPNRFNPDRFDEKLENKHAYIPFLTGPRVCIGQNLALLEIKVMLVNILRHFDLDLSPGDIPKPVQVVSLQSVLPVFMHVKKR